MPLIRIYNDDDSELTPHFNAREVWNSSHPNAGEDYVIIDHDVMLIAEYIRTSLGHSVTISSAFRNYSYNLLIGGVPNSQHVKGKALDLHSSGIVEFLEKAKNKQNEHWKKLKELGLNGLGFYDWGVHVDTRDNSFSFWDYRKKKAK